MKYRAIHHPERLIDVAALRTTLSGLAGAPPYDIAKIRPAIVNASFMASPVKFVFGKKIIA